MKLVLDDPKIFVLNYNSPTENKDNLLKILDSLIKEYGVSHVDGFVYVLISKNKPSSPDIIWVNSEEGTLLEQIRYSLRYDPIVIGLDCVKSEFLNDELARILGSSTETGHNIILGSTDNYPLLKDFLDKDFKDKVVYM
jgi:hypothetical protein